MTGLRAVVDKGEVVDHQLVGARPTVDGRASNSWWSHVQRLVVDDFTEEERGI